MRICSRVLFLVKNAFNGVRDGWMDTRTEDANFMSCCILSARELMDLLVS